MAAGDGVRALQWLRAEAPIDLRRPSLCEEAGAS